MQTYTGRTLRGLTLALDGKRFVNCELVDCRLTFRGEQLPTFKGTRIVDCQVLFQGPAAATLQMLSQLYRSGQGSLVESIFAHLKGEVGPTALAAPGEGEGAEA